MTNSKLKTITLVGGGSTGWMTALYLSRLYNQQGQQVHIRLIESKDIGIIGVGEATVHSIRFFFAAMGIDEAELLRETNATLKTGILFNNWMKPVNGETHSYFHPFEQQKPCGPVDNASAWIMQNQRIPSDFAQQTCLSFNLMRDNLSPKQLNSAQYQGAVPYGYHLDAVLMARFLRKKAIAAGVEHIVANVTDADVENQQITQVITDNGHFSSDIFIDCTGFKGLLIDKLKADNWQSFEAELPCNRAVAIQREYSENTTPRSYTTSTALTNGWVWEIDLTNRQGTGYVYDGNRLTREQAEAELRRYLGDEQKILKATHLDMKIGCRKEFWVGNCIAMGLAGGFIEPLESTGLHLINLGVRLLATHLTSANPSQPIRDSYNRTMNGLYDDLRQFIVLHYCLSNRDDTEFWQQAQASVKYTQGLAEKLALWKVKVCEHVDVATGFSSIFSDENYRYVLYGMQHVPSINLPVTEQTIDAMLKQLNMQKTQATSQCLAHQSFLDKLHHGQNC
ncbi:tryptophan halogenase family protein [Shewanella sp. Isolate11]|uniref:tryptophan halogenase family protein n=1 Tax=Shewanella sp. Isolate11 TaxID=2908530 RepID=UPI001EFDD3E4|nr:tryptophan halogenase family protein [Shewanella sp. Isolate11]MCG9696003.1 tryptophan 7-halogenase [Shewanella sp. Isolate11]